MVAPGGGGIIGKRFPVPGKTMEIYDVISNLGKMQKILKNSMFHDNVP